MIQFLLDFHQSIMAVHFCIHGMDDLLSQCLETLKQGIDIILDLFEGIALADMHVLMIDIFDCTLLAQFTVVEAFGRYADRFKGLAMFFASCHPG